MARATWNLEANAAHWKRWLEDRAIFPAIGGASSLSCRPTYRAMWRRNNGDLHMRHFLLPVLASCLWLAPACGKAEDGGAKGRGVALAVIDFDYIDTSGEERDQHREHEARLGALVGALRDDLAKNAPFRVVTPTCGHEPCKAASLEDGSLLVAAREAGANIVLIGGIHKMSTLVQWAEIVAIDASSGRVLDKKLFTFRGDTDEAWRRAERFIVDEITALPPL